MGATAMSPGQCRCQAPANGDLGSSGSNFKTPRRQLLESPKPLKQGNRKLLLPESFRLYLVPERHPAKASLCVLSHAAQLTNESQGG